jgi:hypothetical protein
MTYRTDVIYREAYAMGGDFGYLHFMSPDGVGRIFFDSVEEAKKQTGLTRVVDLI